MAASKLPMEILVDEIVPKLPAKSLVRFKCVCRYFQTLISSPQFIHRHLLHSLSSDTDRQLILVGKEGGFYTFHLDWPEFPPSCLPLPGNIDEGPGAGLFLVGSCNGLVCMGTPYPLIIFNPCTVIYKFISLDNHDSLNNYGFGFDDVNDDYKIVKVSRMDDPDDILGFGVWRKIEVYSLKSDSWSLVEKTNDPLDSRMYIGHGVLVDNHLLHWMFRYSYAHSESEYGIGCFDLRTNQWSVDVPMPNYCLENGGRNGNAYVAYDLFQTAVKARTKLVHLGVLDGCLCLLTTNFASMGDDVWVMKEYGEKDSWIKLVSITFEDIRPPVEISPFAYARGSRSEILVRMDSKSKFFWYNIRDKTWRWAEIHGVPDYCVAYLSKGSLVNIPGGIRFKREDWIIWDQRVEESSSYANIMTAV